MESVEFGVQYLGSSTLSKMTTGLGVIQKPLREHYFSYRKSGGGKGVQDIGLRVEPDGLTLLYPGTGKRPEFFDMESIHYLEAVRFTTRKGTDKKIHGAFVPIDESRSPNSGNENLYSSLEKKYLFLGQMEHPPLLSCVMRRTSGVKAVDCHVFVISSTMEALRIQGMIGSFQQRSRDPDYSAGSVEYQKQPDVVRSDSIGDYALYTGQSQSPVQTRHYDTGPGPGRPYDSGPGPGRQYDHGPGPGSGRQFDPGPGPGQGRQFELTNDYFKQQQREPESYGRPHDDYRQDRASGPYQEERYGPRNRGPDSDRYPRNGNDQYVEYRIGRTDGREREQGSYHERQKSGEMVGVYQDRQRMSGELSSKNGYSSYPEPELRRPRGDGYNQGPPKMGFNYPTPGDRQDMEDPRAKQFSRNPDSEPPRSPRSSYPPASASNLESRAEIQPEDVARRPAAKIPPHMVAGAVKVLPTNFQLPQKAQSPRSPRNSFKNTGRPGPDDYDDDDPPYDNALPKVRDYDNDPRRRIVSEGGRWGQERDIPPADYSVRREYGPNIPPDVLPGNERVGRQDEVQYRHGPNRMDDRYDGRPNQPPSGNRYSAPPVSNMSKPWAKYEDDHRSPPGGRQGLKTSHSSNDFQPNRGIPEDGSGSAGRSAAPNDGEHGNRKKDAEIASMFSNMNVRGQNPAYRQTDEDLEQTLGYLP